MKKIVAIVQARMTSTRLPNKVLMDMGGKTVVGQVFNQLSFSKLLNEIVLATSTDKSDDPLENWVKDNHIRYFRGNLNNVLKRFFDTAKQVGADIIVRITADCPLIDPEVVDNVISGFLEGGYDYYSNTNPPTFPDGLDTEVFSFATLERAYKEAELQSEIEHVTPYIRNHPGIFKMGNYKSEINYEYLRWTLDNREDYDLLTRIFNALRKENSFISHKEVMNYIDADSNLLKTNAHIKRNEGYIKSLMDDKRVK